MKKTWLLVLAVCLTLGFGLAQESGGETGGADTGGAVTGETDTADKVTADKVQVTAETRLSASPEEVWKVVGNFNGVPDWYPVIVASTLENNGTVRRVRTADGGESVEELTAYDAAGMSYSYKTLEGPAPVTDYTATLSVKAADGGSLVTWSGEFAPAGISATAAEAAIRGFFQAGLDNLKTLFGP